MTYLVQAELPYYTGLARDVVANTFHFDYVGGGSAGETELIQLTNRVAGFYETVFAGSANDAISMAPWCDPTQFRVRIYDLDDTPPRVPVRDTTTPLTVVQTSTGATAPEIAYVLSYRADYTGGVNRARQRGRLYLGGISSGIEAGTPSSFPSVNSQSRTCMADAALEMFDSPFSDNWAWVVYSRTGNVSYPIVAGWVDGELDTQRRRGRVNEGLRTPWVA